MSAGDPLYKAKAGRATMIMLAHDLPAIVKVDCENLVPELGGIVTRNLQVADIVLYDPRGKYESAWARTICIPWQWLRKVDIYQSLIPARDVKPTKAIFVHEESRLPIRFHLHLSVNEDRSGIKSVIDMQGGLHVKDIDLAECVVIPDQGRVKNPDTYRTVSWLRECLIKGEISVDPISEIKVGDENATSDGSDSDIKLVSEIPRRKVSKKAAKITYDSSSSSSVAPSPKKSKSQSTRRRSTRKRKRDPDSSPSTSNYRPAPTRRKKQQSSESEELNSPEKIPQATGSTQEVPESLPRATVQQEEEIIPDSESEMTMRVQQDDAPFEWGDELVAPNNEAPESSANAVKAAPDVQIDEDVEAIDVDHGNEDEDEGEQPDMVEASQVESVLIKDNEETPPKISRKLSDDPVREEKSDAEKKLDDLLTETWSEEEEELFQMQPRDALKASEGHLGLFTQPQDEEHAHSAADSSEEDVENISTIPPARSPPKITGPAPIDTRSKSAKSNRPMRRISEHKPPAFEPPPRFESSDSDEVVSTAPELRKDTMSVRPYNNAQKREPNKSDIGANSRLVLTDIEPTKPITSKTAMGLSYVKNAGQRIATSIRSVALKVNQARAESLDSIEKDDVSLDEDDLRTQRTLDHALAKTAQTEDRNKLSAADELETSSDDEESGIPPNTQSVSHLFNTFAILSKDQGASQSQRQR